MSHIATIMGQYCSWLLPSNNVNSSDEINDSFHALSIIDDNNTVSLGDDENINSIPDNGISITLVPHEHTLYCERKSKVCEVSGKVMEFETLEIETYDHLDDKVIKSINDKNIKGGVWMRGLHSDCPSQLYKELDFEICKNSEKSKRYILTPQDVGYYIIFVHLPSGLVSESALGPVLPAPSQLYMGKLNIISKANNSSNILKINEDAVASGIYVGGIEGHSEYWWIRVKDGTRENLTEPKALEDKHIGNLPTLFDDPRIYHITENDLGWTLKAKCRPIRNDGYRGDVVTSLPSPTIIQ